MKCALDFAIVFVLGSFLACAAHAAPRAEIAWSVEAPLRMAGLGFSVADHRAVFQALTDAEKAAPVLGAERRFAAHFSRGWAETWISKGSCAEGGICGAVTTSITPTAHRISAALRNVTSQARCTWHFSPKPTSVAKPDTHLEMACGQAVTLDVPYPAGGTLVVSLGGRELARTEIAVKDLFVVSMGDSFASGDGNPDRPAHFDDGKTLSYSNPVLALPGGYPKRMDVGADARTAAGAGWLNPGCHRSAYAHHFRTALQLAVEDPHRAITFVSSACWGAAILKGLFLPQPSDFAVPDLPETPQLSLIARAQCGDKPTRKRRWSHAFDMGDKVPELTDVELEQCPAEHARPIDLVLLTVGGNDIGFSQLVAQALVSQDATLSSAAELLGYSGTPEESRQRLAELVHRFKALNRAMHLLLHIPWSQAQRIVLTLYPPMTLGRDGHTECRDGRRAVESMPAFSLNAARIQASETVARLLATRMRQSAQEHGWTAVDAHVAQFYGHGLCAGIDGIVDEADEVRLPRFRRGAWHPYPPSRWRPYATRQRWFRTPNDGYLTTNFQAPAMGNGIVNLLLASIYSGSFHPTAEGQAVMADAVLGAVRPLLAEAP